MVDRYNGDLANNLGNLLARVATVVGSKCGGVGPAPSPDSPLAAVAASAYADAAAAWDNVQPSIALEATWRLVRETNAHLEANEPWKAEPGPEVDAVLGDALEALRIVAILATTGDSGRDRRDLAAHRSRRDRRRRSGCRTPAAWGQYPGGLPVEKGDAAVPPHHRLSVGPMRWTDDHCHLPDDPAEAAEQVADARAAGVERLITVGTEVRHSRAAIAVARAFDGVWATAGVHPHEAKDGIDGLAELLGEPEVVAVGECGLDYHYDHSPRDVQRDVFAAQIRLSHDHGLPLVIHTREAWDDTFAVLEAEGVPARTVFHCFTGGVDEAERALATGAYLSFAGVVTFPSAGDIRAAVQRLPARAAPGRDRRALPRARAPSGQAQPSRAGARGGAAVAEVKGLTPEAVAEATWDNAETVFGL